MTDDPYEIEITVPGRSPSGNKVHRKHWESNRRWTINVYREVQVAMMNAHIPKPPKPLKHAKVTITSIRVRLLDQDRLYGGLTAYLDALQRPRVTKPTSLNRRGTSKPGLGIIWDDSPKFIDYVAKQRVGSPERVVIHVVQTGE